MAAHCPVPASAQPPSRFSPRCCGIFSRNGRIVVVTDGLKTQESFQQDIETWLRFQPRLRSNPSIAATASIAHRCFIRPGKFCRTKPSCRTRMSSANAWKRSSRFPNNPQSAIRNRAMVVTSVTALLQRTFLRRTQSQARTRTLKRGDRIEPLDLVEWLEEQGYEPEAQVTQKGEIALRGGILDVYPADEPVAGAAGIFRRRTGIAASL